MTSPEEPLPERDERAPASSSWVVCRRCGAATPDPAIHIKWHDVIEDRVQRVRDAARTLRDRNVTLEGRVSTLEAEVAALKIPGGL